MAPRVRLGELLVEAEIITRAQLDEILVIQQSDPRRLGTLLVEAGLITETQVTQILSQQLSVPWVSLYHIDFSRQLLNLVPREVAEKYCLVPIFVRRVRGFGDDTLYVAMDDPSDEAAQREVAQFSGLTGAHHDCAALGHQGGAPGLLRHACGHQRARPSDVLMPVAAPQPGWPASRSGGRRLRQLQSPPPRLQPPAVSRRAGTRAEPPAPAPLAAVAAAALGSTGDRISVTVIEAREASMPAPRRGGAGAHDHAHHAGRYAHSSCRRRGAPSRRLAEEEQLTARDLVAALRAAAHGADTDDILGDNKRWEKLFAALLDACS